MHRGFIKLPQDAQIKEVTEALSKAFVDFNTAVGAPKEVVDEEFGHPEITPIAVEGCVDFH